jgi:prepilin-type processing-associated H-X9-DG protein
MILADGATWDAIGGTLNIGIPLEAIEPRQQVSPTIHGIHHGRANVLWADGHVKGMYVSPRTETIWAGATAHQLGDLLHGPLTGIDDEDYYYFELVKPST